MKKNSMPSPVKRLRYIKCYRSSSPRPVKSRSNSISFNCQKISCWLRKPNIILEIRKKTALLYLIKKPIFCNFFKDFTNQRKKINGMVVLSRTLFLKVVDKHWKVEGSCFSDVRGLTMVGSHRSLNFWDFDPLDWLKLQSLKWF